MSTLEQVVEQVTSNMGSLMNNCENDADKKEEFAELCGLTSVAAGGSFAAMVAVHEDLPDIVVKVVPNYDKYLCFAKDMMAGLLSEEFFPKVHAITDMGTHSVVIVERIAEEVDVWDDWKTCAEIDAIEHDVLYYPEMDLVDVPDDTMVGQLVRMANTHDALCDVHTGNFMKRADGTLVCIDPLW